MPGNRRQYRLNIFRNNRIALKHQSPGFGGRQQGQTGARRQTAMILTGLPGKIDNALHIIQQSRRGKNIASLRFARQTILHAA